MFNFFSVGIPCIQSFTKRRVLGVYISTLCKPQSGSNLTKISSGKNLLPYPTWYRVEKSSESLQRPRRPWGPVRTHPQLVCLAPSSQPHGLLAGAHALQPTAASVLCFPFLLPRRLFSHIHTGLSLIPFQVLVQCT